MKPALTGSVLCNKPLKLQESGMDKISSFLGGLSLHLFPIHNT